LLGKITCTLIKLSPRKLQARIIYVQSTPTTLKFVSKQNKEQSAPSFNIQLPWQREGGGGDLAEVSGARAATRSEEPAGRRRGASTVARRDGSSAARARAATRWCGWVPCRRLLSVPRTSIIDGSSVHEPETKRGQGCLCKFFLLWWEDLFTKCLVWLAWILRKHGSTAHLQSM
jgi:hypothetical protein